MSCRRLGTPSLALAHQVMEGTSYLRTRHFTLQRRGTIYHLLNHQHGCGGSKPARTAAQQGRIDLPPATADRPLHLPLPHLSLPRLCYSPSQAPWKTLTRWRGTRRFEQMRPRQTRGRSQGHRVKMLGVSQ